MANPSRKDQVPLVILWGGDERLLRDCGATILGDWLSPSYLKKQTQKRYIYKAKKGGINILKEPNVFDVYVNPYDDIHVENVWFFLIVYIPLFSLVYISFYLLANIMSKTKTVAIMSLETKIETFKRYKI